MYFLNLFLSRCLAESPPHKFVSGKDQYVVLASVLAHHLLVQIPGSMTL